MKKQRYIVEIEMPDGDFISAGWLKDLIQTDCDVEDEGRQKVTVQETSLPSNLDEAAEEYAYNNWEDNDYHTGASEGLPFDAIGHTEKCFKAGAEYMAAQGVSMVITPEVDWTDVDKFVYKNSGDNVIIQIRRIIK